MHGFKLYICIFIHLQIIRLLISQVFLLERASEAVSVYCDVYLRIMNYQKETSIIQKKRRMRKLGFIHVVDCILRI